MLMLTGKSIAAFAVKFLLIYGALAATWPLCEPPYEFLLFKCGYSLFGMVGIAAGQTVEFTVSTWGIGFQSTAILIALVLATRVSAHRRSWALLMGLLILHIFVLVRLAALIILTPVVLPNSFWARAFVSFAAHFIHGHGVTCFVPVLIWVLVTLQREDMLRLPVPNPKTARA